jgi:thiol:disulfide interchange protein DsbA
MHSFRSFILPILQISLLAGLSACGGPAEPPAPAQPPAEPTAVVEPAEISAPVQTEEAVAEALKAVEESAADDDEKLATADEIVLAEDQPAEEPEATREWQYSEGSHFEGLTTAQGTSSPPDKIEIAEVFWYGCPHCFSFDPYLANWEKSLPDDVNFIRIPVMWNPTNQTHARVFYTAEALGKLDEMHESIFREMHEKNKTLTSEDDIRSLFENFDVSADEFNNTYRSFAVESKLKRARNLTERYKVRSVPLLIINGKYKVKGSEVKNFDDMIAVANELIEKEREQL